MILIACVDDDGGLMFHERRQSQDRAVRADILSNLQGRKLWMNAYSAGQFAQEQTEQIVVDEQFLTKAASGDFCFLENSSAAAALQQIEALILYKWNKKYPADFRLDISLSECGWELEKTETFPGFSHTEITKEVYRR